MQDLRMPCQQGAPFSYDMKYIFRIDGLGAYGFRADLGFAQWLGLTQPEDLQRLPADTMAMGCPFDVRVELRQPLLPNHVAQVGDWQPRRVPMLEWLRSARLALPDKTFDSVFGDAVTFTVPCLKIAGEPSAAPAKP